MIMANIQNKDLKDNIRGAIASNELEGLPTQILDKVSCVIDVNPAHQRIINVVKNSTRTSSGTSTVYTPPSSTDKVDSYLMAVHFNNATNAANDGTSTDIACYPYGDSQKTIISHQRITLTAINQDTWLILPVPLRLRPSNAITMTTSFTAGAERASCTAFIVEVERF